MPPFIQMTKYIPLLIISLSLPLFSIFSEVRAATDIPDGLSSICVQLNSTHQSRFAGLYTAKEEGYYREAGLLVNFIEGGGDATQVAMGEGKCPLGVATPVEIALARRLGMNIKAVAAMEQTDPAAVFTAASSGITGPRQLKGRTIAMNANDSIPVFAMLITAGVEPGAIKVADLSPQLSDIFGKRVDAVAGTIFTIREEASREGMDINVIHPSDYGAQFHGNVIYATSDAIAQRPDTLKRFLKATLEGWMRTLEDPRTAVAHTLKYTDETDAVKVMGTIKLLTPYIHTGEYFIGTMDQHAWEDLPPLMLMTGMLSTPMEPGTLYDTTLVDALYEEYP